MNQGFANVCMRSVGEPKHDPIYIRLVRILLCYKMGLDVSDITSSASTSLKCGSECVSVWLLVVQVFIAFMSVMRYVVWIFISLKEQDTDKVAIVGRRCSMIDSCVGVVPCWCFQSASLSSVAWFLVVPILIGKVQAQTLWRTNTKHTRRKIAI